MLEYIVFLGYVGLKFLLFPTYSSTDFEVHRNWKAITNSLNIKEWYYNEISEWTLDYPPLFAYFEFLLGFISKFIDPLITQINNLDYKSDTCLYFMRATVLLGDLALFASLTHFKKSVNLSFKKFILLLILIQGNTGLIIIDNIHFQYNSYLFSLLIFSISYILRNDMIKGAIFYTVLVCFKHIFLYCAPAYVAFYLKYYLFQNKKSIIKNTFNLSICLISIALFTFGPFIFYSIMDKNFDIFTQILKRLFPFKRGLIHSYWAPNFWALYTFVDKLLFIIFNKDLNRIPLNQSTSGKTQDVTFDYLYQITPSICLSIIFILSIILIIVALIRSRNCKNEFLKYLNISCFIFFNFGFQVHEKAIINNSFIITLLYFLRFSKDNKIKVNEEQSRQDSLLQVLYIVLNIASSITQFPLIFTNKEYFLKGLLIFFYLSILLLTTKKVNKIQILFILSFISIIIFFDSLSTLSNYDNPINESYYSKLINLIKRYRFLPLMSISVISSIVVQFTMILSIIF